MSNKRRPIAMIDETGYVLPYADNLDERLPVRYLYSEREVALALEAQKEAEESRARGSFEESEIQREEVDRAMVEITEENAAEYTLSRTEVLQGLMQP